MYMYVYVCMERISRNPCDVASPPATGRDPKQGIIEYSSFVVSKSKLTMDKIRVFRGFMRVPSTISRTINN